MDRKFVICLGNEGYPAALERHKIYVQISDLEGERLGLIRVIDESGEDYLYPKEFFAPIQLPRQIALAILEAAS